MAEGCHTGPVAQYTAISAADWNEITVSIGGRLRRARESMGLSEATVAERAGMIEPGYSRLESGLPVELDGGQRGTPNPQLRRLHSVAAVLGVPVADLVDIPQLAPPGAYEPVRAMDTLRSDEHAGLFEHQAGTDEWWAVYASYFGIRVRARRFQLGMTMAALSDAIDVETPALAALETVDPRRPINPTVYTVALIAKALTVPLVDLLPVEIA